MRSFVLAAGLSLLASNLFAAPVSVSTGVAGWTVSQTSGLLNNSTIALNQVSNAVVLTGGIPVGIWVNAPGGSAWVGQNASDGNFLNPGCTGTIAANAGCGAQVGTYQYVLSLTAGVFGGILNFNFTGDNLVSIVVEQNASNIFSQASLNGSAAHTALYNTGNIAIAANAAVRIVATLQNDALAPGNLDRNPSGFLVSGTMTDTPEPSTYAMLGLGALALGAARLRRK